MHRVVQFRRLPADHINVVVIFLSEQIERGKRLERAEVVAQGELIEGPVLKPGHELTGENAVFADGGELREVPPLTCGFFGVGEQKAPCRKAEEKDRSKEDGDDIFDFIRHVDLLKNGNTGTG